MDKKCLKERLKGRLVSPAARHTSYGVDHGPRQVVNKGFKGTECCVWRNHAPVARGQPMMVARFLQVTIIQKGASVVSQKYSALSGRGPKPFCERH